MALTVDHLRAGSVVRVIRAFRDGAGRLHPVGENWTVRSLAFDAATLILTFTVEREGMTDSFALNLRDEHGPRIGRMREWFEAGESGQPCPRPPTLQDEPETLAEVCRLAKAGRYPEAHQSLLPVFERNEFAGENLPNLAAELEQAAIAALPHNREAASWLYEQAIGCWYGWGSLATSGGDGAARLPAIQAALRRQKALFESGQGG